MDSHSVILFCASCNAQRVVLPGENSCAECGSKLSQIEESQTNETVLFSLDSSLDDTHELSPQAVSEQLFREQIAIYRFESLLGAGAMGKVYLATHEHLERKCAVKILSPKVVKQDEDYVSRFQNEGRTAAALVHPNIVTTHAIGEHEGFHFLEMEYISGKTLRQLIQEEGALTPLRATGLAYQIAEGLGHAHAVGIIHSDLKVENVLLNSQGIPKIVDFGLAKQVKTHDSTTTTRLVGTPHYMSPELFSGVAPNRQSDVYALGVCYFVMLTGKLPYQGETLTDVRKSILDDPLPSLRKAAPDMSLEMGECLSLLMAKAPTNRPRDGIEAAQLLQAVMGGSRDLESLIQEAFSGAQNITWNRNGLQYTVQVTLPDGRGQKLYLEPSHHRSTDRLLLIYSTCCPADPAYYEQVLRLNAELSHGSIAVREIEGRTYFVMVDTYPRATVDAEEIRRSVLELAYHADDLEKELTGQDHH
ncbi:MAG: protein kinase [Planctomycetaceae bacterium]|nr:protein kinase [Planctomycetaceae bacterium]